MNDTGSVLICVPTYNEAENIAAITKRIMEAVPHAHILIADDNSPDGTGDIADALANSTEQIHVLHREQKAGLGAAYCAAFAWGIEHGYQVLVEHDADGSHNPKYLPAMLQGLQGADVVKGSRWVKGGKVVNWPKSREFLSRLGNLWANMWLGLGVRDATGGFTAWKAETLQGIDYAAVQAVGYCFQVDLVWRAVKAGYKVAEIPITFEERLAGQSKMSSRIVIEAMLLTTRWGIKHRLGQLKSLFTR
ncbi:MAG: polyprenol monophosphomannose synthase [Propionibacteriaceae bacterium]|nr:polyprenol monophosphomannose synthase [Propionibacteriaceae bacterium]